MSDNQRKHSYTIPCSSSFRDSVTALAERRGVNVGDIARSVLLVLDQETIVAATDPGDPPPGDRETVMLKSGPAEGRPWRRKPRLQVRMAPGYEILTIRKALGIALSLEQGKIKIDLDDGTKPPEPPPVREIVRSVIPPETQEELERLRAAVSVLGFDPLPGGVESRAEALHVLGFPPGARPDSKALRARFRMLATIHHPDSSYGSHQRMSQLNAAMDILRTGVA